MAQHVAEDRRRREIGVGGRHDSTGTRPVGEQGHHRRGRRRRRRADQLGDADDVRDPSTAVVPTPRLDAHRADATLEVWWAEHRQARRQAVSPGRRASGADPRDGREAAVEQQRVGEVGAVAVASTDRLGEPAQLPAASGRSLDPLPVVPAERPSRPARDGARGHRPGRPSRARRRAARHRPPSGWRECGPAARTNPATRRPRRPTSPLSPWPLHRGRAAP